MIAPSPTSSFFSFAHPLQNVFSQLGQLRTILSLTSCALPVVVSVIDFLLTGFINFSQIAQGTATIFSSTACPFDPFCGFVLALYSLFLNLSSNPIFIVRPWTLYVMISVINVRLPFVLRCSTLCARAPVGYDWAVVICAVFRCSVPEHFFRRSLRHYGQNC